MRGHYDRHGLRHFGSGIFADRVFGGSLWIDVGMRRQFPLALPQAIEKGEVRMKVIVLKMPRFLSGITRMVFGIKKESDV